MPMSSLRFMNKPAPMVPAGCPQHRKDGSGHVETTLSFFQDEYDTFQ